MINSVAETAETEEAEPPSCALSCLEFALKLMISRRFSISQNEYDRSVSISHRDKSPRVVHEMFRVYLDREVGDNSRYIGELGHPQCAAEVKDVLVLVGYSSFHNPFVDYIHKRFDEERERREELQKSL
jgi:hypothetical protein